MELLGKPVADALREQLRRRVAALRQRGIVPTLAILRLGDDPAGDAYLQSIRRQSDGIALREVTVPAEGLLPAMEALAQDAAVHGILPFLPLPEPLRGLENDLLARLPAKKDVDGLTAASAAGVYLGKPLGFTPCTAEACLRLLDAYGIDCAGKRAVVVGRSAVVGRPVAHLLMQRNATVTVCHRKTKDLAAETRQGDVVIAAAGCPGLLGEKHIRPGAVVLDVGTPAGDVQKGLDATVSPVPGGVGAVTTAILLEHTVRAAEDSTK